MELQVSSDSASAMQTVIRALEQMSIFHQRSPYLTITTFLLSAVFLGCGTMPGGRGWGQDATLLPGWQKIRKAAVDTICAPETWVPAGAALILQVGDMDTRLAKWAVKKTPVYGSNENADETSDKLRNVARGLYLTSVIGTPSGSNPLDWAFAKGKGFAVEAASVQITRNVTGFLKGRTKRTRPNEANDNSFPSHHASETAAYSILASRNIKAMQLPGMLKSSLQIGALALDAGTAWARVEAERHYPSDVLAGMAIGHFFGAFITDAFLGLDYEGGAGVTVEPSRDGFKLAIFWSY